MTENAPQTPTEQLARRIVARLGKEGLLSEDQGGKLLPRLIAGSAKGEDWRFAIETSLQSKADDNP